MIEKLSNLIKTTPGVASSSHAPSIIADHLIANGVTIQQWIPVTERLPEHFKQVLLWDAIDEDVFTGELDGNNEWFIAHFEDEVFNITHWMPLPEPPKEA